MKIHKWSIVAATIAVFTSGFAQASAVSLSNISAEWYGATPAGNV